ncbi:DegV family protein [Raoultibacter phocaeensis]|uniref:DegV family protein n=1 Tax=Raoultibacter phocaeensis TaxID=2479841 RepID=UPI0011191030|nr:DegV family protein [Raoultibacter phocaeensis]
MSIAIVTDSTCDWSLEEYERRNVVMVPLTIQVGEASLLDQVELVSEDFYDRMIASDEIPLTSQPSPGAFAAVYERLAEEGFDAIVSLHLAPVLSGTLASAEMAAEAVDIPVVAIDSKNASSSLGLLVEKACVLRDEGATFEEIAEVLRRAAAKTHLYLAPDSTDNLVKGGRISPEQAQGAAMLNIKLVFALDEDGRLVNLDKVKGAKGVIKRLVEAAQLHAEAYGPLKLRFMHARNGSEVEKLIEALREAGIEFEVAGIDACGATVATHAGIGVIGMAVSPLNG